MATRVAVTNLNSSTMDILNTIRANASYEYQSMVPTVEKESDIQRVGDVLYGYPSLANQFINALVNRIALVSVKSATFNNAYAELKKGYLEFGETVEEVFVNICKAREFSAEKAEAREFKRSLPDVRTAFHSMNWRVQYPITIQDEDLRTAFMSITGVQDLIAKIVDAVYTAAEYDEYLLFKYLIIKAVTKGKMYPVSFDPADMKNAAVAFRGTSNMLTFMGQQYNAAGVHTSTPKNDQYIFMDATFNANYDVNVLSAAFNMDNAMFMGHLKLIDSFTTFDNDRFSSVMSGSEQIELVTEEELALMADVKAVIVDKEWFQVYDKQNKFTEKYVAAGEYWNYFYNVWKIVSSSPFSNAVVFVDDASSITAPTSIEVKIDSKSVTEDGTNVFTLFMADADTLANTQVQFIQDETATTNGVAIHKYGAIILPTGKTVVPYASVGGATYRASTAADGTTEFTISSTTETGEVFYLTPVEE